MSFKVTLPISGQPRISSWFGWRTRPKIGWHSGVDYAVGVGTPVLACYGGEVVFIGPRGNYGQCVIVQHHTLGPVWSLYAHLSAFRVRVGDWVKQGQELALSGNTGYSTGPHLHFELRVGFNGILAAENPLNYLS